MGKKMACCRDAEIVCVVGVFPDVLAREDQIFPSRLFHPSVDSFPPPGASGGFARGTGREVGSTLGYRIQCWRRSGISLNGVSVRARKNAQGTVLLCFML